MRRTVLTIMMLLCAAAPSRAGSGYSVAWLPEGDATETTATARPFALDGDIDPTAVGGPSVGRAVLYSLLVPGLGDYYLGNRTRAYVFFGVEAAIWTTFAVSRVQGSQREDSYQEYAVRFAGVDRTGHSDDYYALLREYDTSVEYEAVIKQEGREDAYTENSRNPDVGYFALEDYFVRNRVADYSEWQWKSLDNKVQYQEIRSASKNAYRRSSFALAAAAANRLVAAIFTYTSARRSSGGGDEQARRYHIDFTPPRSEYDTAVTLIRQF